MRITLKRSGTFKCHWSSFEDRCGTSPDPIQEYKYECEIETNDVLDSHGFVLDQLTVNNAMQKLFFPDSHTARSCEMIAIHATGVLGNHLNTMPCTVHRIRVGVGVIPPKNVKGEAMIYAEWTR